MLTLTDVFFKGDWKVVSHRLGLPGFHILVAVMARMVIYLLLQELQPPRSSPVILRCCISCPAVSILEPVTASPL
jgi:hypothetical protein